MTAPTSGLVCFSTFNRTGPKGETMAAQHAASAGGDAPEQKATISFHRSYRRVTVSPQIIMGGIISLAVTAFLLGGKMYFLPDFTAYAARRMQDLFAGYGFAGSPATVLFGGRELAVFQVLPAIPSPLVCGCAIGAASLCFLLLYRLPLARPTVVIVNLLACIVAFFAALFLLLPGYFNAENLTLAAFFLEISIVTALALPVLFWLVTFPLPTGAVWKLLNLFALEAALFGLFWLKYAIFILLCAWGTYLVAPLIIFFLCSLLDVVYMVALFSLMVSRVSRRVAEDVRVWQWM
ncbi:membrane hypothetical protein [uncultured delta proteobacterium]|uniref:Uncharacterized protein n=1 Tax=uncultured delta proteobacterium TaxID=34034 RepID=A0A212JAF1_9DELT|nr:membrane hypothetical protein [uncultured delta proteobacterium]